MGESVKKTAKIIVWKTEFRIKRGHREEGENPGLYIEIPCPKTAKHTTHRIFNTVSFNLWVLTGFSPKGVREVQHHSDGPIFLSCG